MIDFNTWQIGGIEGLGGGHCRGHVQGLGANVPLWREISAKARTSCLFIYIYIYYRILEWNYGVPPSQTIQKVLTPHGSSGLWRWWIADALLDVADGWELRVWEMLRAPQNGCKMQIDAFSYFSWRRCIYLRAKKVTDLPILITLQAWKSMEVLKISKVVLMDDTHAAFAIHLYDY